MTRGVRRYVLLKSIVSFSFAIITSTTFSQLKIVAILSPNNYMYHIFLIEQPVHLFQTWPGKPGVYKYQDRVLVWDWCINFF